EMLNMQRPEWEDSAKFDLLEVGHKIGEAKLLFDRIEDAEIDAQLQRLENIKVENEKNNYKPQPIKENVSFDDFMKVDIRVGTVLECVKVPKADKLLQFKIDDGMGGRTIVSGIAKYYPEPEKLVGMQVCFIANFEPRKLKGVVSEGMILSAEDADGRLVLLQPSDLVKSGVKIG
ncbi:MAG: methionine--tRNA ligase subunit beta, partial [Bacteroidales bacterium]|nr:methionine--tRNA ligase subunit beta [Bacteroidales bacterium]